MRSGTSFFVSRLHKTMTAQSIEINFSVNTVDNPPYSDLSEL